MRDPREATRALRSKTDATTPRTFVSPWALTRTAPSSHGFIFTRQIFWAARPDRVGSFSATNADRSPSSTQEPGAFSRKRRWDNPSGRASPARTRLGCAAAETPLVQQLEEAVTADDPELAAAQKVLLRELVAIADASVTKTLIDLASDTRTSPDLLLDVRAAIAKRRSGAEYMEAALKRHYDYLKDVLRAPPVGPIADALGAMKAKSAAPLLAAHLVDPNDTEDDIKQIAAALAILAGPSEVPAMRQFFAMYRATAADDDIAAAVVSVGQALIALQGKLGRTLVEGAASDPMTVQYVREHLSEPEGTAP